MECVAFTPAEFAQLLDAVFLAVLAFSAVGALVYSLVRDLGPLLMRWLRRRLSARRRGVSRAT